MLGAEELSGDRVPELHSNSVAVFTYHLTVDERVSLHSHGL